MAPEKAGGLAPRKGSKGRGKSEQIGRTAEKDAAPDGGITLVDIDPWSAFFEKFWEQPSESEHADRRDGERKAGKSTRMPGTKPVRPRRLPRAS
jgi:hypothetical protein